ncbi:hypothetical protein OAN307_c19390 [Octadecabacter antarcticus 307]|uniref:Uncharacterized protein n=1 Tax=Octadecabacter antarcticus 307 TaxID=391626 RepID=M9R741_9RHOB|nr:hypothetical protein [Octadecabacter antarcticus]AGI67588.1 hypothetical protein OAN307_c19390 [Octadecabacter antarcticus 307]
MAMVTFSPGEIQALEKRFVKAWTGANSTPFIVDAPLNADDEKRAIELVRYIPAVKVFELCPTIACWGMLKGLSEGYDGSDRLVYRPISNFTGWPLHENHQRDALKSKFRKSGRSIGIPIFGTDPTDVFFGAVGPVKTMYADIANAFVRHALYFGLPAIEDTTSSRHWQRRAVAWYASGLTRLQKAVVFDVSSFLSRRFEAWRQGETPLSANEEELFEAFTSAVRDLGRGRKDLVGPPKLCWSADRLGLEPEKSQKHQTITIGKFPTQISGGERMTFAAPWQENLRWQCGASVECMEFAPKKGEVLVFDADTGKLFKRMPFGEEVINVAAEHLVALAAEDFECPSFGQAIPAKDHRYRVAWIEAGEVMTFASGAVVKTERPTESAMWIDGHVIGKSGGRTLYSATGRLVGCIDPEVGGKNRILRAVHSDDVKFATFTAAEDGSFEVSFKALGFLSSNRPGKVRFEVLAPGAAGDMKARSEITVSAWLWPAFDYSCDEITELPLPSNFSMGQSRGLRLEGGRLFVDLRTDGASPVLGLIFSDEVIEFDLFTRSETLTHNKVNTGTRAIVSRGALLSLGQENRHDTFRLTSGDKNCDLLVLGEIIRRPFLGAQSYEVPASHLQNKPSADDRIALKRDTGEIIVFARLRRVDDPVEVHIEVGGAQTLLRFKTQSVIDAVRVVLLDAKGHITEGEIPIGRIPVDGNLLSHVSASMSEVDGFVSIDFDNRGFILPTRAEIYGREEGARLFRLVTDASGAPLAVGLGDEGPCASSVRLADLARLAAKATHAALEEQMSSSVGMAYASVLTELGARRMVGAIKPVLNVEKSDDLTPRHDLVGLAPWIFQAPGSAFGDLSPESGLTALAGMVDVPDLADPPDPRISQPLTSWLERLQIDVALPEQVSAQKLSNALNSARFRMRVTDLRVLLGSNSTATVAGAIIEPWRGEGTLLRSFEKDGGGDDRVTKIAYVVESFARSCALGEADEFVRAVTYRTGFDCTDVGRALTLMMRADVEVFVYFKNLWTAGLKQGTTK